jgi:hypothetical protein
VHSYVVAGLLGTLNLTAYLAGTLLISLTADRRPPTAWRRRPRRLGLLLTTSGLSVLDTSTSGSVHDRTGARRGSVVTVVADFVGAVPGASREGHSGDADAAAFSCMKAEMSATSRRTSTSSSMVVAVAPVTPT